MTKRTAKELWDALDEATLAAELESELALTPEERRQELIKEGYDIDKVHAQADAFFASLPAKAAAGPQAEAVPAPRPKRMRAAVIVSASLALAAGAALVIKAAQPPPPVGARPPLDPQVVRAEALRREARDACDAHVWKTCVDKLDEARALDPEGDGDPEVQALRRGAAGGRATP
jgi:hypothetical protein